jgi:hypothetical protein
MQHHGLASGDSTRAAAGKKSSLSACDKGLLRRPRNEIVRRFNFQTAAAPPVIASEAKQSIATP